MVTSYQPTLSINRDRLAQSIVQLASIGALPNGGVRRIAYNSKDVQARRLVQDWMQTAGMSVRIDPAGNIIGRYPGRVANAPALATGSHIDTVPMGGRYDGAFGVLSGLEVVRTLQEQHLQLNHPLEVIVFTDEEGSMIGSKAMAGHVNSNPAYYQRPDGTSIQACLDRIGGSWDQISHARRTSRDIAAFVELHVEQGPVLESMGKAIGVVEGIVGQRRFNITVQGRANHAGTTPMSMRQDALVAAAQIVLAINRLAQTPGQQVATVGQMQVTPNAANVVPGRVEMSLDLRDLSTLHLDRLMEQLKLRFDAIAFETQCEIQIHPRLRNEPAPAKPHIQQAIVQTCQELGFSYTYLPSRASHDAQEMARFTDMGMIFVPSQEGLSHSEAEYTSPEHCTQGADTLLQTLLKLDQHYGC